MQTQQKTDSDFVLSISGAVTAATGQPLVAPTFRDRADAGQRLAKMLTQYDGAQNVIVLALPREGVRVGYEIAAALKAPLDVFVVQKLLAPGHEDIPLGAISSGGVGVVNPRILEVLNISEVAMSALATLQAMDVRRCERTYRNHRPDPVVQGHTIILVDDGGATLPILSTAIHALRRLDTGRIILAIPVVPATVVQDLAADLDSLVAIIQAEEPTSVTSWYDPVALTTDQQVRDLLTEADRRRPSRDRETSEAIRKVTESPPGSVSGCDASHIRVPDAVPKLELHA